MNKKELDKFFENNSNTYMWTEHVIDGKKGLLIYNSLFDTKTHFTWEKLKEITVDELILATHHGKNIEHITRVTGFFSKVSGWNTGKRAELKDRNKGGIDD